MERSAFLGNHPTDCARLLDSYLQNQRLQLHNYNMRQNRRWLTAKIHTIGDVDIPKHVRWPLMQHWKKTEHHQQNPKISDGLALTTDVKYALDLLRDERAVAAALQGNPERVADWWVQPEIKSKKKRKRGKNAKKQGATAGVDVNNEGLGDDVGWMALGEEEETVEEMEGEKEEETKKEGGGVLLEERYEGFDSPVMMSPTGSVVSDGEVE